MSIAKVLPLPIAFLIWCAIPTVYLVGPIEAQQLSATIEKDLLVFDTASDRDVGLHKESLSLLFDGQEQAVVAVEPLDTSGTSQADRWRIVVYVDPALASPLGLEESIATIASSAEKLTRLGSVEIVVADPFADQFLEPTRSADQLIDALADLEDYTDAAGEVISLRQEMIEAQESGDSEGMEAIVAEEGSLQSSQRTEFLAWIAATPQSSRPTCVIFLQDGYDLNPFGALPRSPASDLGDRAFQALSQEQQTLAAVLASEGWIALSLAPPRARDGLLKSREDALWMLTEPTGGSMVTNSDEWQSALRVLQTASRVRAQFSGFVDGIPRPVVLRTDNGRRLRTSQWLALGTPLPISEIRAHRELEDPGLSQGDLEIRSVLRPDQEGVPRDGGLPAILEAMVPLGDLANSAAIFRVTLLLVRLDEPPAIAHQLVDPGSIRGSAWLYRKRLELPSEVEGAVVVIEDLESGKWGVTTVEPSEAGFATSDSGVVEWNDPSVDRVASAPRAASARQSSAIRVLPPRRRPARGKVKLNTLVSTPIIRRVDFYLDGDKVDSDDRPPFGATVDLGDDVATHTVKAVAYGSGDARLGEHEVVLNPGRDTFQVRITEIQEQLTDGSIEVAAEAQLPIGKELDRVEFFLNETMVEVQQRPPFAVELPRPESGATDFVRVVAYLKDGTWIDDAQLLASTGLSERLDVNLVELHVMVSDRQGDPVTDLELEDFTVRLGGAEQTVERLAFAQEVPLILGLVVDTSESMWALMPDTKKAGAQFLTASLDEGDSAFLVDFDTQPRLAHGITEEVVDLLRAFNSLTADGYTALYDATIFSMLQFEETRGRRALVVLTDGDDYKSKYGPRRCVQYGKRLGVPVYVISLAAIQNRRRNARRPELEGLAESTGGQVFYINEMSELSQAYSRIDRELRSQYVLTFSTDRFLAEEELDAVDVEVDKKGLEVRAIVGGQQVQ
jgi:Ca-activated chloride channel family protein